MQDKSELNAAFFLDLLIQVPLISLPDSCKAQTRINVIKCTYRTHFRHDLFLLFSSSMKFVYLPDSCKTQSTMFNCQTISKVMKFENYFEGNNNYHLEDIKLLIINMMF